MGRVRIGKPALGILAIIQIIVIGLIGHILPGAAAVRGVLQNDGDFIRAHVIGVGAVMPVFAEGVVHFQGVGNAFEVVAAVCAEAALGQILIAIIPILFCDGVEIGLTIGGVLGQAANLIGPLVAAIRVRLAGCDPSDPGTFIRVSGISLTGRQYVRNLYFM